MPNIIEITDLSAPDLNVYTRLTETQLRSRVEPEKGVFIAESPKVIHLALDADYQPLSFPTERRHIEGQARELLARCFDVAVYTVRIPMSPGADSLNVAAASAIAFWQFCAH